MYNQCISFLTFSQLIFFGYFIYVLAISTYSLKKIIFHEYSFLEYRRLLNVIVFPETQFHVVLVIGLYAKPRNCQNDVFRDLAFWVKWWLLHGSLCFLVTVWSCDPKFSSLVSLIQGPWRAILDTRFPKVTGDDRWCLTPPSFVPPQHAKNRLASRS